MAQQTVVTTQPITVAPVPQNVRPWATGLCGCCEDVGGCKTSFYLINNVNMHIILYLSDVDICNCGDILSVFPRC